MMASAVTSTRAEAAPERPRIVKHHQKKPAAEVRTTGIEVAMPNERRQRPCTGAHAVVGVGGGGSGGGREGGAGVEGKWGWGWVGLGVRVG